jgi:transglutaminase-like putative cysteine protease
MTASPSSLRIELACFAALAAFAVLEWVSLVADPPTLRAILVVAVGTAAGLGFAALGLLRLGRTGRVAVAAVLALAAVAIAMIAIGLPGRLLLPAHWDELGARLDRTLPGVADVSIPYDGADRWTRLTLLLAAPLAVGLAAFAAFWPIRRRTFGRLVALALLIALYVTAVAWSTPGGEVGRGLLLLALVSAWLWLPGLTSGRRSAGLAAIATASVIALPLATVGPNRPLLDYRSWGFLSTDAISFNWDHSYGPLDWPQRGSLLFRVASDGAHYWKATNLDSFDGVAWRRSQEIAPEPAFGQPQSQPTPYGSFGPHPEWVDRINFEVRGLSSEMAVGAGTTLSVRGLTGFPTSDATWELGRTLERGDSYTVLAYTPEPSPAEMRAAPPFPAETGRYTTFSLPPDAGAADTVQAPFWRRGQGAELASELAGGPYEATYALAREVTADAATPYDAARQLELYLRGTYAYDQDPGEHAYPLPAFLFEDRRGYCQQFSGAMALMLRMMGIPSRVASGFAPGGRDPRRGVFLVEDVDAHSWVEVYFTGIGWVPFEPTPAAAPAEAQLNDNAVGDTAGGPTFSSGETDAAPNPSPSGDEAAAAKPQPQPLSEQAGADSGLSAAPIAGVVAALIAIGLAGAYALRALRRKRLDPEALGDAELAELGRALAVLDRPLPAGATLREVERRLMQLAGPEAAGYASALRERRYRRPSASPPGIAERRGLRRSLLAARGWRRALAVLVAISPGGPPPR